MIRYWFPWESRNMLSAPWKMQLTMAGLALALSVYTWIRDARKKGSQNQQADAQSGNEAGQSGQGQS